MAFLPLAATGIALGSKLFGQKSSTWSGTKPHLERYNTLNHGQRQLLRDWSKNPALQAQDITQNPLYQQGGSFLSSILSQDPRMMQQFQAPAMRQFNEEIIPQLSERFAGLGAGSSSAFQQALGQAGSGLAERLAAMRANLGMQAQEAAMGYAQQPFQNAMYGSQMVLGTSPYGYQSIGGQPGVGQGVASAASNYATQGLNSWLSRLPSSSSFGGSNPMMQSFNPSPTNITSSFRMPGQIG